MLLCFVSLFQINISWISIIWSFKVQPFSTILFAELQLYLGLISHCAKVCDLGLGQTIVRSGSDFWDGDQTMGWKHHEHVQKRRTDTPSDEDISQFSAEVEAWYLGDRLLQYIFKQQCANLKVQFVQIKSRWWSSQVHLQIRGDQDWMFFFAKVGCYSWIANHIFC
jgi:hypothetical protein